MPEPQRLAVRVKPGSSRTRVGGSHGTGARGALVVAVTARAVEGAATEAALVALADALGVRRRQVRLVRGEKSRDKLVEIVDPPDDLTSRVGHLLVADGSPGGRGGAPR